MLTDVVIANKSYTKLNLSEECEVDSIAFQVIKQDCPEFLLPMKMMEIDGEREIRYELQEGIRLAYMPKGMNKKDFVTIIVNMLIPFKTCNDWFLDYHNFLLDENYILVGKNGQSIKYIYIPAGDFANSDDKIKDFFTSLILKIDISDDPGYMVNALRIIKNPDSNLMTLLEYFQKQSDQAQSPAQPPVHQAAPQPVKPAPPLIPKVMQRTEPAMNTPPQAPKDSYGGEAFGKSDEEGRLLGSLFGEAEEPETEKGSKNGKGLFGWMKGKPKEEKPHKEQKQREKKKGKAGKEDFAIQIPVPMNGGNTRGAAPIPNYEPQPQNYPSGPAAGGIEDDTTTIVEYEEESSDNTVLRMRLEDCVGCVCPDFIEINLAKGFATVGRKNKNGELQSDFNFDASISFVSRRHFRVEKNQDQWQVIDLESGNGTYINQNKLVPNIPYPLNRNDVIMISCNKRRLVYRVC